MAKMGRMIALRFWTAQGRHDLWMLLYLLFASVGLFSFEADATLGVLIATLI